MKRTFEIFFTFIIFLILFIPMTFIAIIIKIGDNGKIIHWSKRIGINNEFFYMPKFRTMKEGTPNLATHLISNPDNYLTFSGKFLRKFS